jgi:hypothetical protein
MIQLVIYKDDDTIADTLFFPLPEEVATFVKEYTMERMSEPVDYIPLKFEIIQG